jgi:hypothetical protein
VSNIWFVLVNILIYGSVLHPQHKLEYFKSAGWDAQWIKTACMMVRDIFDSSYKSFSSKIMFALSYIQGGKAQFWQNEAINQIAVGHKPFWSFVEFFEKLEMQFGDPNPKVMTVGKLKMMRQGGLSVDEFILQFKAEASHTERGNAVLIEY